MLPGRHAHRDLPARRAQPNGNIAMSSTIAMSFIPCAAENQWRCSIWSIVTSSFPAAPTPLRSTPCSLESARDPPAAPCVRLLALAHERTCEAELAVALQAVLDDGVLPGPQGADRTLPPEGHGIAGRRRHAAIARHLRPDRRGHQSRMNATDKIDAAGIDLLLGELRLPGIKLIWTALAQTADKEGWPAAPLPGRPRRTGDGGAKPAALRTSPGGSPTAAGKDPRRVRLRCRADDLKGASAGARRRRCLARKGCQSLVFWPALAEQIASGGGARHGSDRKGLARVSQETTDLVQKLQIAPRSWC